MLKRPSLNSIRSKFPDHDKRSLSGEEEESFLEYIAKTHYSIISAFNRCVLLSAILYILAIASVSYAVESYGYIQKSYFSNKNNVLNQYFVKLGWGWTFSLLCFFVGLTSYIRSAGSFKSVVKNLLRMGGGTAIWYISISIFDYVHSTSGYCAGTFAWDLSTCKPQQIKRIDISGHTFLLLFCILVTLEELRLFEGFYVSKKKSVSRDMKSVEKMQLLHSQYSAFVYLLVIMIVLLFALWHVMLLSTVLYFHDTLQKFLGGLFATTGWFILYNLIYKMFSISPGADL